MGEVPIRNHKPAMVVYVVSYMFVCSYFMMNTFVGVVCVVPASPAAPRRAASTVAPMPSLPARASSSPHRSARPRGATEA